MVLHKPQGTKGDLGLKVIGGRRTETGRLGAFVTRVKRGSVADVVGRLRTDDEVLEWNGRPLQNATHQQVYDIISSSKNDAQVELIVSRNATIPGGDDFLNVQSIPSVSSQITSGMNDLVLGVDALALQQQLAAQQQQQQLAHM
uniref:PDZ domain-containing protein n=1 Tax=Plectus sambesii TaxID=2011161 RepID=A0A914V9M0_9BILA